MSMMPLHIPDEELHAYLDQALPRSRCVTIESHLAACGGCRTRRDATAALRDRTTQLLARLTPERKRIPPSFEELGRRSVARAGSRIHPRQLAWAASILLAVGAGYGLRSSHGQPAANVAQRPSTPVAAPVVVGTDRPAVEVVINAPAPSRKAAGSTRLAKSADAGSRDTGATPAVAPQAAAQVPPPAGLEVSTDSLPPEPAPTAGLWRTVPWNQAQEQAGAEPARVNGVPVVEVQVKHGEGEARPVTVVAQQLSSGQLITTIEGPVEDVWALLSRRGDAGDTAGAQTLRQGERLLAVTGQLPADSLRAMVRRVNAARRVR